jgi:hypothetical protein
MINNELHSLFSRRGLFLLILIAMILNTAIMLFSVDTINNNGYSFRDIKLAYANLPKDDNEILLWLDEKFEASDFNSYVERLLYIELYQRVLLIINYKDNLHSRLEDAELMKTFPFFAVPNTFDYRSLHTLHNAYGRIAEIDIQPMLEHSLGIELATNTQLTDVILAFSALALTLGVFMLPKEEGYYTLLKPMRHGKSKLLLAKYVSLLYLLFMLTILIYGVNLLVSHTQLGLGDLSRPIQSIYGFSTSRFAISVWQFLVLFVLSKYLWLVCLLCLFICICIYMKNSINACLVSLVVLVINILLYQSTKPWFLMTNLIWIADVRWYFSGFYNLNFFSYPVDALVVGVLVICITIIIAFVLANIRFAREENVCVEKSARKHWQAVPMHTSVLLHEGYKLFISQRGFVILILLAGIQLYVVSMNNYYIDYYDRHYAHLLAGQPSVHNERFLMIENLRFEEIENTLEQYSSQLINGVISEETFRVLVDPLATQLLAEPAFRRAQNQYTLIEELAREHENIEFVELQAYDYIFGTQAKKDNAVSAVLLAIFLALGLSALFSVERNTNMDILIASFPLKQRVNGFKIMWAGLFAVLSGLIAFVPKILYVNKILGLTQINASIRSFPFALSVFGNMSIVKHIIFLCVLWILSSCIGTVIAVLISRRAKSRAVSIMATGLTLVTVFLLIGWITNQI